MNLRCAIVDDEPLALGLLESYIKKTSFLELSGSYSSAIQAMKYLPEHPVDVLFLDIQMPELSGLEFSRMVPKDTRIIFTTAFDQYALDGYRVNALDYLLKPISYSDFMEAINKAVGWFELQQKAVKQNSETADDNKKNYIYVKSDYKLIQIELNKILYIEGLKDYIKIHLEGEERPILSLVSMRAMEEKLPADKFIRVHRSFIVHQILPVEQDNQCFRNEIYGTLFNILLQPYGTILTNTYASVDNGKICSVEISRFFHIVGMKGSAGNGLYAVFRLHFTYNRSYTAGIGISFLYCFVYIFSFLQYNSLPSNYFHDVAELCDFIFISQCFMLQIRQVRLLIAHSCIAAYAL